MIEVKICGINSEEAMAAASEGGAAFAGLVFFPPSPRHVDPGAAARIAKLARPGMVRVGLFVDPTDELLKTVLASVPLDLVQLHGQEDAARVAAIKRLTGLPAMKAIAVETAADIAKADSFLETADRLLFDAKPPKGSKLPGGNAVSFDWRLLTGKKWPLPWMLAGGLHIGNFAEAVAASGAGAIDVSSGVEDSPGRKNPQKILDLLAAARKL